MMSYPLVDAWARPSMNCLAERGELTVIAGELTVIAGELAVIAGEPKRYGR